MTIALGSIVRDHVTGFTGVAENRAIFLYGCNSYCIQPKVGEDGKMPKSCMVDEPQLEVLDEAPVMVEPEPKPQLVELGGYVQDPVREQWGTVTGRAVYLNGCSRVLLEPKQVHGQDLIKSWWVDEQQVAPVAQESDRKRGGPARSSSKF